MTNRGTARLFTEAHAELLSKPYPAGTDEAITHDSKFFDLICPPGHWKDPIDGLVTGIPAEHYVEAVERIVTAIVNFTATVPFVSEGFGAADYALFQAEGYRAGPAGDH